MTTLEIIKELKLDLSQAFIDQDQYCGGNYEFDITPKEFLNYGKQDFKSNDTKGNINAITNAKRAIDCQTDKLFFSIGLDPKKFPNKIVEDFISKSKNMPKKDLPIKLRLLQAINFAPAKIISNVRQIRNALEHNYKNPTREEVSDTIELAELFIQATDSKLRNMIEFGLTDKSKIDSEDNTLNIIWFHYKSEKNIFEVTAYKNKKRLKRDNIENSSIEFYYLLKIATSFEYIEDVEDALVDWIEFIGHPIPRKNINIEI